MYGERRCEIQVGCQEMDVMVGKWKNFNNDSSGELVVPPLSFTRTQQQIHLNCCY